MRPGGFHMSVLRDLDPEYAKIQDGKSSARAGPRVFFLAALFFLAGLLVAHGVLKRTFEASISTPVELASKQNNASLPHDESHAIQALGKELAQFPPQVRVIRPEQKISSTHNRSTALEPSKPYASKLAVSGEEKNQKKKVVKPAEKSGREALVKQDKASAKKAGEKRVASSENRTGDRDIAIINTIVR